MKFNKALIAERIKAFAMDENELSESVAHDIAFHMTDWVDDFEQLAKFFSEPSKTTDDDLDDLLRSFLIHVPNHLAAASRLFTGLPVRDIFGVGSTSEDEDK